MILQSIDREQSARSVPRPQLDCQILPDIGTIAIWVPNFLKGILDLIRRILLWYGGRWVSDMGYGEFIGKKHLKPWAKSDWGKKSKIEDGCAFSLD